MQAAEDWSNYSGTCGGDVGPVGRRQDHSYVRLLARPELNLRPSVSATTRSPRVGERDGVDYHFVTTEAFQRARDAGQFLEWAEVHGFFYGTPLEPVRQWVSQGVCALLDIDVQGGQQVKARVSNVILIWIQPPSLQSLEARLRARQTDDEPTIRRRLDNARREIEAAQQHYPREYFITNEDGQERQAAELLAGRLAHLGCPGAKADA